jgi:hypothetical protein
MTKQASNSSIDQGGGKRRARKSAQRPLHEDNSQDKATEETGDEGREQQ